MNGVRVAIVVARARNGVIGRAGGLPWRLKSDMAHFKAVTMGKPVIMGRTTWESLPRKPLPGRMNIIITRNPEYVAEGAIIATTIEEAIRLAQQQALRDAVNEICIIGGAQIYELAMPYVSKIYLTEVEADVDGDARFDLDLGEGWINHNTQHHPADDVNEYPYSFRELTRLSNL